MELTELKETISFAATQYKTSGVSVIKYRLRQGLNDLVGTFYLNFCLEQENYLDAYAEMRKNKYAKPPPYWIKCLRRQVLLIWKDTPLTSCNPLKYWSESNFPTVWLQSPFSLDREQAPHHCVICKTVYMAQRAWGARSLASIRGWATTTMSK